MKGEGMLQPDNLSSTKSFCGFIQIFAQKPNTFKGNSNSNSCPQALSPPDCDLPAWFLSNQVYSNTDAAIDSVDTIAFIINWRRVFVVVVNIESIESTGS